MAQQERRRVLITGIATELAGRLAARLEADERVEYLAGVDFVEPSHDLVRTEFVRADLRNPLVAKIVDSTKVDTIIHLAVTATPGDAGGRTRMKELNVIGSMQLLAAAQKSPRLNRVVVKSTTAVYGSHYTDPSLLGEDAGTGGSRPAGYTKDAIEVERYARGFARRRTEATLTILRFANFLGPKVDSPLTGYFALPVVPTVLGFDPRLQFCHIDDAVEILVRSAMEDHPGTYNVAGPGILYLSQALRIAGKPSVPIPLPLTNVTANLLRRTGRVDFSPDQLRFLQFGRVGDISRMRVGYGYEPVYSTRDAFCDFIGSKRIEGMLDKETAMRWERELYQFLGRRSGRAPLGRQAR